MAEWSIAVVLKTIDCNRPLAIEFVQVSQGPKKEGASTRAAVADVAETLPPRERTPAPTALDAISLLRLRTMEGVG
jgi:hypothetical protein